LLCGVTVVTCCRELDLGENLLFGGLPTALFSKTALK
jgi:hypothetical protein